LSKLTTASILATTCKSVSDIIYTILYIIYLIIFKRYLLYMPFVSEKQRRLCWYLFNKAIQEGKSPVWNCPAWQRATINKKLPKYKKSKKSKKRKQTKKSSKKLKK
jgi:hypothetical protein